MSFRAPIKLFSFPFLFPSYCHSVVHRVFSFMSGGCNESSFVFLYIVFKSMYGCVNAVFNAGKFSSSLFSIIIIIIIIVMVVYPGLIVILVENSHTGTSLHGL